MMFSLPDTHCTMEHTDRTPLDISGSIPFLSVLKGVLFSHFGTTPCPVQQLLERLVFLRCNKLGKKCFGSELALRRILSFTYKCMFWPWDQAIFGLQRQTKVGPCLDVKKIGFRYCSTFVCGKYCPIIN